MTPERSRLQIMELLFMQEFTVSFIPVRFRYTPRHPVLKHPDSMLFPKCERQSLTLIIFYILIFT
jgi:hypothetical protein